MNRNGTTICLIAATLLLLAASVRAADLGYVTGAPDFDAHMGYRGAEKRAATNAPVQIDYFLQTDQTGKLRVWFGDERIHFGKAVVELANGTQLELVADGDDEISLVLLDGELHLVGRGKTRIEQAPQKLEALTIGTELVVEHDAENVVTRVSVLSGLVLIRDLNDDSIITLSANQFIEIRGGERPGAPGAMSNGQQLQTLMPFDFIGKGRAESQTVVYPGLTGATLPGEDCAPRRRRDGGYFTPLDQPVTQPPESLAPARLRVQF